MFNRIVELAKSHNAEMVILFGSRAKGRERDNSDIDVCIVAKTDNKRRFAATISAELEYDLPVDVLVYTPEEWELSVVDESSFAHKILSEGMVLYGQQKIS